VCVHITARSGATCVVHARFIVVVVVVVVVFICFVVILSCSSIFLVHGHRIETKSMFVRSLGAEKTRSLARVLTADILSLTPSSRRHPSIRLANIASIGRIRSCP
jgi:hypothetical protein